jgi:hypothetical protein
MRQAWTGEWPGYNHRPLRVEAAAWHGRPVFFSLIGPWTNADRMPSTQPDGTGKVVTRILMAVALLLPIIAAVFMARWNFVHAKGDRSGAMRLAILIFSLHMALWILQTHFASVGDSIFLLFMAISTALLWGGGVWVLYLAVEPYVRRYWPQAIISWTRVLSGRWRDPLVGRDVLYGLILGLVFCVLYGVRYHLEARLGAPPGQMSTLYLANARSVIGAWFAQVPSSIGSTLVLFLFFFLCRVLLRNSLLAAAAFVLVWAALKCVSSDYPAVEWPMQILLYSALAAGALRFGLVSLTISTYVADMALNLPITPNPSAWYFTNAAFALASIAALAIWAFYTALAGQVPWKTES